MEEVTVYLVVSVKALDHKIYDANVWKDPPWENLSSKFGLQLYHQYVVYSTTAATYQLGLDHVKTMVKQPTNPLHYLDRFLNPAGDRS